MIIFENFRSLVVLFVISSVITSMSIRNWTDEQIKLLKNIYPTGTSEQIREAFPGKKLHAISEFARKRGISKADDKWRHRKGRLAPLLENSLQTYYWIGFLMADGYVHHGLGQIVVASASVDKKHLEEYAKFLGGEAKVYKSLKSGFRSADGYQVRVSIAEKKVCELLVRRWDWKPNKTYNPPSVEILGQNLDSKEKYFAFLCGFIDGDGYIRSGVIKIENHPSWQGVHDFLLARWLDYGDGKRDFSKKGYSVLQLRNKSALAAFKTFLIDNGITILVRKWVKIDEKGLSRQEASKKKLEDISGLIKLGKTVNQIAVAIGKSSDYVRSFLARNNILTNYERNWKRKL